jgi:hypothetical protein
VNQRLARSSSDVRFSAGTTMMQDQFQPGSGLSAALAAYCSNIPAERVVESLSTGLAQLRELLTTRLHKDVERQFGVDSLDAPLSELQEFKQIHRAEVEIDAFSAVVAADEATQSGYVNCSPEWFLDWALRLRFGDGHELVLKENAEPYRGLNDSGRQLRFASALQRAVPESFRAPRLLFKLFPQCVRIVTAAAFQDAARADKLRTEQRDLLAAIGDCRECHGRVLNNGQRCDHCGNPVWTIAWLHAS